MADIRESTPTLEISGTQVGAPIHRALEGDATAAKNAQGAFSFKDIGGNFRYALVDASDRVVTTSTGVSACLNDSSKVAGSATFVAVATITLLTVHDYEQIGFIVACTRDAAWKITQTDDVTDTILAQGVIAKETGFSSELHCLSFTSGASGAQTLTLSMLNNNALSDLYGTLAVTEIQ